MALSSMQTHTLNNGAAGSNLMDIAALYFDLLAQQSAPKKQKSSSNNNKQMDDDELLYWKCEIAKLRNETRSVCKLNWHSSYFHKTHILVRNHYGDKSMPDELWEYWVLDVKRVQEQLIQEGYTPDKGVYI